MIVTVALLALYVFQSTHPLRGATQGAEDSAAVAKISIHAPLAGCDDGDFRVGFFLDGISIHAPLAGCDECDSQQRYERLQISIHAPLAGCDHGGAPVRIPVPISIHAPLAGCDTATLTWQRSYEQFQSTHPLRGATSRVGKIKRQDGFQSTHPLRGATPGSMGFTSLSYQFQSTHPLRGATHRFQARQRLDGNFNPRTPCGVRHPFA